MKRSLALCALLCLLLALSGCRAARVPGLDWDPEEMVELQLYQGAVPAGAQRKTTTDPEKIRQAAQALFSLRVERDAVNEDVPAGGIGTYFVFVREDSSQEVMHLGSGGELLSTGEGFYKLRHKFPLDQDALWNSCLLYTSPTAWCMKTAITTCSPSTIPSPCGAPCTGATPSARTCSTGSTCQMCIRDRR